jgi:uncharacterized RmlC-like cupin family protein
MDQSMASEKDAVRIVRGTALEGQFTGPGGTGRADVSDFTGAGSAETWVGLVKLPPLTVTGPHNHGEQGTDDLCGGRAGPYPLGRRTGVRR